MAEKTPVARSGRAKRPPVNGRNVLSLSNKESGYEYRFVNDVGDRVESFKERGWELVDAADVSVGERRVAGSTALGSKAQASVDKSGMKAFVMRIPSEWYAEDQAEKAKQIAETEKTMKQQALSQNDYGKLEINR